MKAFKLKDKIFEQLPESNCLSNAVRQLMRKHFMHCSPDYQMFLFLFQEFQEKKDLVACGGHIHFPVVEDVDETIAQGLAGTNGLRYCCAKSAETADHREGADAGSRKLYWVMAWGTACEANAILARIILEELVPKVYDLALLDELGKRSDKNLFWQDSGEEMAAR